MMKLHPYCAFFDQYRPGPLKELADDIKANGQHDDILTFPLPSGEPAVLDGRNRFLACEMAGVEPRTRPFEGSELEALNYVKSKNFLPGRYVTPMQRAEIATKMRVEMARLATASGEAAPELPSQREVADLFGVSRSTLQRAEAKEKGSSKEPEEPPSWTIDEIRKDPPLLSALTNISHIYGDKDTKAIREGTIALTRSEILFLGDLPAPKLQETHDLIMGERWKPKKALEFLDRMPTADSTIRDIQFLCRATKDGVYTGDFDGFTLRMERKRK